ncbi:MAG: hypothetical protein CVT67_10275 [Actinobacteria bacterium HGW-Actinobacteria-7]|jgi:hypothetical protein|nr:MAG: hypothetical protein CVT67_10275 [Actinobacteria bacterium HGW-Actinobacteria-7]
MVLTPVGYKCPEHARAAKGQYQFVKPRQLAQAVGAGLLVGVGGAFVVAAIGFGGLFIGLIWGSLTSEAVRRASGGHRGGTVGTVAALSLVIGSLIAGVGFLTSVIALVVALVQLAVIEFR